MNKKNVNSTIILPYDKKYPTHVSIPVDYFTSTPDNVIYVRKCSKCNKNHRI